MEGIRIVCIFFQDLLIVKVNIGVKVGFDQFFANTILFFQGFDGRRFIQ